MTVKNLISKLTKNGVTYTILDYGYNKDIEFMINGITFKSGFTEGKTTVEDFCSELYYDNCNQEIQRRFFDNFNQVLRYAQI